MTVPSDRDPHKLRTTGDTDQGMFLSHETGDTNETMSVPEKS